MNQLLVTCQAAGAQETSPLPTSSTPPGMAVRTDGLIASLGVSSGFPLTPDTLFLMAPANNGFGGVGRGKMEDIHLDFGENRSGWDNKKAAEKWLISLQGK